MKDIKGMLDSYGESMKNIFGDKLVKVILYGSYARGDFNSNSDVDIMILADVNPQDVSVYADKVYDVSYDFEMDFEIEINPVIQSRETFEYWKEVYPFFYNIEKEGIAV